MIRIVLADDHALVRAGVRLILEQISDVEVIAEVEDGHQALDMVLQHHPDILLMDVIMPGLNGLEAVERASEEYPRCRVIMLSMDANEVFVLQALRAGAAGYVLKNITPGELEEAIRSVMRGEIYLSSSLTRYLVDAYVEGRNAEQELSSLDRLTSRQREILQLVAEGHTSKSIAKKLGISTKTVDNHRTDLMDILEIRNVAGLVRYAIRMGLVQLDD